MTDPMTGGAAKIAEEMLKEVQTSLKDADKLAEAHKPKEVEFQHTLDAQKLGEVQHVGQATEAGSAIDRLRDAIRAQRTPPVLAAGTANDTRPVNSNIARIFDGVMDGQNKLEKIIELSISGKQFSAPELLALQAGVYRFTQELELTSKVVEKGTSSIKQTLNTQV